MVSFGDEAMVCIGIAAVDGFVAAATADRQRPGGCQPAGLLPSKRRPSLHDDDGGDAAGRFRHAALGSTGAVPAVENSRQTRSGGCRRRSSVAFFQARDCGRRNRTGPFLPVPTPCGFTLRTRSSCCKFLHGHLPGLVVSRARSITHRIACGHSRARSPLSWSA